MKNKLRILPIGGLGEIGNNMMLYQYGNDAIIVDCGIQFADKRFPGIDLIIPDFKPVLDKKLNLRAVLLTHGHEDHIGALPFLLRERQIPIYASKFTRELVTIRLTEHSLLKDSEINLIKEGDQLEFGPFGVEFIRLSHSIADALALSLSTPEGRIIHTGDFKIDPKPADGRTTDMNRIQQLGDEGVFLLLSDSTNVEIPAYSIPESSIRKELERILSDTPGWFIVASFASHIPRIRQIIEMTQAHGRKLVLAGRSMIQNVGIGRKLGYLKFPDDLLIDLSEVADYPRNEITVLSTGTQGEPRAALSRMALGQHKDLKIRPGDRVVFSSRFIPGNDRAIFAVINHLYRRGAEVVTTKGSTVHASGHACREDLRQMLKAVRPTYFIPIHGEYRMLFKHIQLAREVGIPEANTHLLEDGDPIEISNGKLRRMERVELNRSVVDGRDLADLGSALLRDRRHLSEAGIVVALVMMDSHSGEIVRGPELFARGLASEGRIEDLIEQARKKLRHRLEEVDWESRTDVYEVQDEIQVTVRRFFKACLERKPVVIPIVIEV